MTENYWDLLMSTDENAATYMDAYGEGPGFATRFAVGTFLQIGDKLLDVGCGPGWNYEQFTKYGPDLYGYKGIDYSERFVRVANQRNPKMYELGDARELKEADKSWDVVLLQDCLEHTNGYEKPVIEALRVARRRVIITFWHLDDNEGTEHINDDGDDGWGAWYDKDKWEEFLDSLRLQWVHFILAPKEKNHKWNFYILEVNK